VNQAVQTTRPLLEAQAHQLSVELPAEPIYLEADEARVVQVLVNLLGNAGKYTERGGRISLTAAREGDEAVLRVRDNGVGIEADMLGRIFDLFAQIGRSLHRAQGGLGVGLTLVRQLVELHGGKVSVHSDGPGKGSEFVVCLPIVPAPVAPSVPTAAPVASPACHVLIIEDNTDARETLATLLRMLGHRTDTAATGPEGVRLALAVRPQVVLIDLGLPGLDGFQVARQIRAAQGKAVRLVALTGYVLEEDRRRTEEAGFDAHLPKPVELEELNRVLAGVNSAP
ncbi:MAG TPA: ATP-binding protein, partial [Gemmataceae bacterium]